MDILVQCSASGLQLSNKLINKECYFDLDVFQLMVEMVARHGKAHFSVQVYTSVLLVYLWSEQRHSCRVQYIYLENVPVNKWAFIQIMNLKMDSIS